MGGIGRPDRSRAAWLLVTVLAWSWGTSGALAAEARLAGSGADEDLHRFVRLVAADGEPLLVTGFPLSTGDRFVAPDDRMFEVVSVKDGLARARELGRVRTGSALLRPLLAMPGSGPGPSVAEAAAAPPTAAGTRTSGRLRGPIAIYHTHSDESYLPTSGRTNVPWNGDVFKVGAVMSELFRRARVPVYHSYARHDPHDGLAYARSRRTAMRLLRLRPSSLIDVHRDTPPAWVYRTEIGGQTMSAVLLVVGRQNPGIRANEAFAFSIKGYADRTYPRLIRGILYAAGDYNQDLHPRAILTEVGSTYNTLGEAERGARLLAGVFPAVLAGIRVNPREQPPPDPTRVDRVASRSGWQTAFAIIVVVAAGGAIFLLINEDGYEWLARWKERLARRLRL
ncbi:stage II sporulation protein P [Carboxydochorda subterranea]|uniref:Stage II sporulation protein P n=1 Tax=Carboxydichorda subterranea TaxID=3109565 RepID=A0ABZ1C0U9_9FIRM|nr:stage II sporulation protein P [Limnochorda sp. L945t]WRP18702.1 stage II sporulation protein P [Limnochorda sp. L945t]